MLDVKLRADEGQAQRVWCNMGLHMCVCVCFQCELGIRNKLFSPVVELCGVQELLFISAIIGKHFSSVHMRGPCTEAYM